jgi:hypothetical protein
LSQHPQSFVGVPLVPVPPHLFPVTPFTPFTTISWPVGVQALPVYHEQQCPQPLPATAQLSQADQQQLCQQHHGIVLGMNHPMRAAATPYQQVYATFRKDASHEDDASSRRHRSSSQQLQQQQRSGAAAAGVQIPPPAALYVTRLSDGRLFFPSQQLGGVQHEDQAGAGSRMIQAEGMQLPTGMQRPTVQYSSQLPRHGRAAKQSTQRLRFVLNEESACDNADISGAAAAAAGEESDRARASWRHALLNRSIAAGSSRRAASTASAAAASGRPGGALTNNNRHHGVATAAADSGRATGPWKQGGTVQAALARAEAAAAAASLLGSSIQYPSGPSRNSAESYFRKHAPLVDPFWGSATSDDAGLVGVTHLPPAVGGTVAGAAAGSASKICNLVVTLTQAQLNMVRSKTAHLQVKVMLTWHTWS